MRKLFLSLSTLVLTLLPASAAIITGKLDINTSGRFSAPGGVPQIDYLPFGGNTGSLIVSPTSTGSFAGLGGGFGLIADIDAAVPGEQTIEDALVLLGFPQFDATITSIDMGVHPQAVCATVPNPKAGQACTPIGSILNLLNTTATSSTASFTVRGFATDGSNSPVSAFIGVITLPFSNQNFQQVAQAFQAQGFVESSAAGSFVFTAVPEPASMILGGLALVSLGLFRKRVS